MHYVSCCRMFVQLSSFTASPLEFIEIKYVGSHYYKRSNQLVNDFEAVLFTLSSSLERLEDCRQLMSWDICDEKDKSWSNHLSERGVVAEAVMYHNLVRFQEVCETGSKCTKNWPVIYKTLLFLSFFLWSGFILLGFPSGLILRIVSWLLCVMLSQW